MRGKHVHALSVRMTFIQLCLPVKMDVGSVCDPDNDLQPPSSKKRSLHGAATYGTKYDPAWKTKFPCIQPESSDIFSFFCTVCNKKISCKHQGITDVKRHIEGLNHSKLTKEKEKQSTLVFRALSDPINMKVRYFELIVL